MMVTFKRLFSNTDETASVVLIDDDYECYGLEDQKQETKVDGETRIPAGKYAVKLRTDGSIHPRYEKLFPDTHKGMLWLQDVPGFTWIYIHIGNTDDHTAGCLLVGQGHHMDSAGTVTLRNSKKAYEAFYKQVINAAWNGSLEVEIIDEIN